MPSPQHTLMTSQLASYFLKTHLLKVLLHFIGKQQNSSTSFHNRVFCTVKILAHYNPASFEAEVSAFQY